jgi:3-hydroxy-9,10-secoandrosta-1,3,5(10)-triene-9,17-dione monooxygenase
MVSLATVEPAGAVTAPDGEALIATARSMIPSLRERAPAAVKDRRIPDRTIAEMTAAGFFRILQPRRHGGLEMHPNVFFDVQRALAEGCMSTGWVYGVLGCHPYELALFDDRAQEEVWGGSADTLVSSSYQPVGKVERADGGFHLSGRWGFSSGSEHCAWVLLGALVPPAEPGGAPDMRTFLVPRADYEIVDAWDVFGLQATGSHDIVVDRAFVPEYRTHRAADGFACTNPGQTVNDGPLYRLPWAQIFVRSVSTAGFGGARAAVAAAIDIMASRVSTNTGKASAADPLLQAAIARAQAQIIEMELTQRQTFDALYARAEQGQQVPLADRALFAYQSSTVVRRLADLVDDLLPLLGGRAIYMSSAIVQPWLDLHAARAHVANDPANRSGDVIGTALGQAPTFSFL